MSSGLLLTKSQASITLGARSFRLHCVLEMSRYSGVHSWHSWCLHSGTQAKNRYPLVTNTPRLFSSHGSTRHLSTAPFYRAPLSNDHQISPVSPSPPAPIPTPGPLSCPPDIPLETSSQELWATDAARILAEGETFSSLGLNGYSPVGMIQSSMELIYNTTGLPWWGTIVASTLFIRVLFFPISIYMQKNAVRMHNVNPKVEKMKERQQMYMLAGDAEMATHERNKMTKVFKEHGIHPLASMMPMVFQGVFLVSFFMAIRGMARAPVTSMMAGGALWFPDLTVPDPSFLLPIISSAGFLISLEVSTEI